MRMAQYRKNGLLVMPFLYIGKEGSGWFCDGNSAVAHENYRKNPRFYTPKSELLYDSNIFFLISCNSRYNNRKHKVINLQSHRIWLNKVCITYNLITFKFYTNAQFTGS